MKQLKFSRLAAEDLNDIHDYIAEDSPTRALRFINRLEQQCQNIVDTPGMGRLRADLAPALRSIAEGQYVIFYRPTEDGVLIMRVLNGARDIQPRLFEEDD